jgi:HEPN domain-containing protein
MREEALKWYQQALEDLLTAEHLFNTHRYYAVAFLEIGVNPTLNAGNSRL